MAHTPGGWAIDGAVRQWTPESGPFDSMGAGIATTDGTPVVVGGMQDEQGGAVGVLRLDDARLIAVAPELLGALELLVDFCDRNFFSHVHITQEPREMKSARAVIAKAKGKP